MLPGHIRRDGLTGEPRVLCARRRGHADKLSRGAALANVAAADRAVFHVERVFDLVAQTETAFVTASNAVRAFDRVAIAAENSAGNVFGDLAVRARHLQLSLYSCRISLF